MFHILSCWTCLQTLQCRAILQDIQPCIYMPGRINKLSNWIDSLTFDNQDGRGGQALHVCVNNTHVLPSMVQLDVANHQVARYALQETLLEKLRPSESSSLSFWLWEDLHSRIVSRPLICASLQTPTTDMADVLCTNNAVGCPSGAPWLTSPQTLHKHLPAIHRTH